LAEYRGHEENLIALNKLLGIGVFTESGDEVGEIEDVVVDPETGLAAFVIVDSELFGQDLKAVPTNIMKTGQYSESFVIPDNKFAGDLPSDYRATKHGAFPYENAKKIYSENEMRDNVGVLRKMKAKKGNGRKIETTEGLIEASVLEGIRVVSENDAPIGNLDTMLVDLNTMMITLALVRMTGPDLTVEEIKAVPWPALKLDPANYRFEVAVADEKKFEKAPRYIRNEADFSIDAARSLYRQFGFKYYQTPVD
jgi:sporulation protein YlmC with PRC-barrel domain